MKFLLDMGISIRLVPELRSDGHAAAHIADLSTGTLADTEIIVRAREEGQVLLVHDLDFPLLMAASGFRVPSVIVFRLRNMQPDNVLTYLRKTVATSKEALEQGAIVPRSEASTSKCALLGQWEIAKSRGMKHLRISGLPGRWQKLRTRIG